MHRNHSGRSIPALTLALAGSLGALAGLAWLVRGAGAGAAQGPAGATGASAAAIEPKVAAREPDPRAPAPEAELAQAAPQKARFRAFVRDARSGAALNGVRLEFEEVSPAGEKPRETYLRSDAAGSCESNTMPLGSWHIRVSAAGYRRKELGVFATQSEQTLELGIVELAPLPVQRGLLLDAGGQPAALHKIQTVVRGRGGPVEQLWGWSSEHGTFEIVGDLPKQLALDVHPPGDSIECAAQRFEILAWPEGERLELHLSEFQRLVLNVYEARLDLGIYPVDLSPQDDFDSPPLLRAREINPGPGTRRFECFVAAGRYRVWGSDLSQLRPTQLEVRAGLELSEFAVRGN